MQVGPAAEASTASAFSVDGSKRRRIMDGAGSAPSGIVRTHDGRVAEVIAVTPGGVAIPMTTAPIRLPPARRDSVVSAVRKRGGVVGRNVVRRVASGDAAGATASSSAVASDGLPNPSVGSSAAPPSEGLPSSSSCPTAAPPHGFLDPGSLGPGPSVPVGGTAAADGVSSAAPRRPRSSVRLPYVNAPSHVLLREVATPLLGRFVDWFRNVRARRGDSSPSA